VDDHVRLGSFVFGKSIVNIEANTHLLLVYRIFSENGGIVLNYLGCIVMLSLCLVSVDVARTPVVWVIRIM
jgi:hypothetical protein